MGLSLTVLVWARGVVVSRPSFLIEKDGQAICSLSLLLQFFGDECVSLF